MGWQEKYELDQRTQLRRAARDVEVVEQDDEQDVFPREARNIDGAFLPANQTKPIPPVKHILLTFGG